MLSMLLVLTNVTRMQSVHLICLNNVHKFKSEFVFKIDDLVKQSRPGIRSQLLVLKLTLKIGGCVYIQY